MAKRPPREKLTPRQVADEIGRLCDHYGYARDNDGARAALWMAIEDGLLVVPAELSPRKLGRKPRRGPELVEDVEIVREALRLTNQKATITEAIKRMDDSGKWRGAGVASLRKRYYAARKRLPASPGLGSALASYLCPGIKSEFRD